MKTEHLVVIFLVGALLLIALYVTAPQCADCPPGIPCRLCKGVPAP